MTCRPLTLCCLAGLAALSGCAATRQPKAVVVAPASPAQRSALFDQVRQLEGTWEVRGEDGKPKVGSVFAVTSGGSAVREIMFPGQPHEMTNMYHMDGPALIMTHYCAVGNQPRLRAEPGVPHQIYLKFDGVSNMTSPDQTYMGEMRLVMVDKDHIREEWKSLKHGNIEGDPTIIELTRKQ